MAPTIPGSQGIKFCVKYLASHPHKPIFYPFNYYDGSNFIRFTWRGHQVEDYKTQNCLECHQDADQSIIINIIFSVSGILHTLIGIAVWFKLHILSAKSSDSTGVEIRCMYKSVKKDNVFWIYMESLVLHTGAPTLHWEDNIRCIYFVEAKIVTPRVKHIGIPVYF